MKIRILIQIILITLAIHSTGCTDGNDKKLWGKSEYGMTQAQVLKIFPDAKKNPEPNTSPLSNSQSHVIIPSKRIYDLDFKIEFYFNNQGLVQVTLVAKLASRERADFMNSLLDEKYGEPINIKKNSITSSHVDYEADWYSAPLSVNVIAYGDPYRLKLFIIYDHSRYEAMNSL
jgi:hypothetical protein